MTVGVSASARVDGPTRKVNVPVGWGYSASGEKNRTVFTTGVTDVTGNLEGGMCVPSREVFEKWNGKVVLVMGWVLLVEETVGSGQSMRWGVGRVQGAYPEWEQAAEAALVLAREYAPNHPWSESGRQIYRTSESAYLVDVQGATATFPFRVSVAQRVE